MAESRFSTLNAELLSAGVQPEYARRLVEELRDHHQDLVAAKKAEGVSSAQAAREAAEIIGPNEVIVCAAKLRPELLCWCSRWPLLRHITSPLLLIAMAPLIPIAGAVERSDALSRWACAVFGGALITAITLFLMQASITLG